MASKFEVIEKNFLNMYDNFPYQIKNYPNQIENFPNQFKNFLYQVENFRRIFSRYSNFCLYLDWICVVSVWSGKKLFNPPENLLVSI